MTEEISCRVASVLRISIRFALTILLAAIAADIARLAIADQLAKAGIGLVAFTPLFGVIIAGFLFYKHGKTKMFFVSIAIAVIYFATVILAL